MKAKSFKQENLTEKDWESLFQAFIPEGAFREMVVTDLNESDWDLIFRIILKQFNKIEVRSKGSKKIVELKSYAFEDLKMFFEILENEGEPTTYFFYKDKVRIHLSIYEIDRAELTLNPNEITDKASILIVLNLMFELSSNLNRTVKIELSGYQHFNIFEINSAGELIFHPENMPCLQE